MSVMVPENDRLVLDGMALVRMQSSILQFVDPAVRLPAAPRGFCAGRSCAERRCGGGRPARCGCGGTRFFPGVGRGGDVEDASSGGAGGFRRGGFRRGGFRRGFRGGRRRGRRRQQAAARGILCDECAAGCQTDECRKCSANPHDVRSFPFMICRVCMPRGRVILTIKVSRKRGKASRFSEKT